MNTLLGVELWCVAGTGVAIAAALVLIRVYWRRGKGMTDQ